MKILLVHNHHRLGSSSGDDVVYNKEFKLLEEHGHQIMKIIPSNDEYGNSNAFAKLFVTLQVPWSFRYYKKIKKIISSERPDIIHVHNFFPFVSPSVFYAAHSVGIPVIQTTHDFRYLCPMAFFVRNGKICKECINGGFFTSIRYGCFKGSNIQTIPPAFMNKLHSYLNTFKKEIDAYICLSKSQKKVFSDAGFDEKKLYLKPNFVEDTFESENNGTGDYVVFFGRLGEEKGISTLVVAWSELSDIPLKIVGDGPDANEFRTLVKKLNIENIEFLGYRPYKECMKILGDARFFIMPSVCNETFGLTIVEAFCHYKPVIASNLGAMADLVTDGRTGLLFTPGDSNELAEKVQWLWDNPGECRKMGENARREYLENYTPERNYQMLMEIYHKTIEIHKRRK